MITLGRHASENVELTALSCSRNQEHVWTSAASRHFVKSTGTERDAQKTISVPVWTNKGYDRVRTFGLDFTAHSRLLEGLLLLLNRRALFNGLTIPASTSEEHGGETVSDGRTDGNGACGGGHLGQHPRTTARLCRGCLVRDGRRLGRVGGVRRIRSSGGVSTPGLRGRVRSGSGSGTSGASGLPL